MRSCSGDPDSDPRHPLGVARGIRVLGVDRSRQGADDAEEQPLEIGIDLGIRELGLDQRGDMLDPLDLVVSERTVFDRIHGKEAAERSGRHRGITLDDVSGCRDDGSFDRSFQTTIVSRPDGIGSAR